MAMLTDEQKIQLKKYLEEIGRGEHNPEYIDLGICGNVKDAFPYIHDVYNIILRLACGWPKHSGDNYYPILDHDLDLDPNLAHMYEDCTKAEAQYLDMPHWEGRQEELRRELCLYMAAQL
jgi:hypothetical protein